MAGSGCRVVPRPPAPPRLTLLQAVQGVGGGAARHAHVGHQVAQTQGRVLAGSGGVAAGGPAGPLLAALRSVP